MENLPPDINKCALAVCGVAPVLYTVEAFLQCGVSRFCVVTGYAGPSVRRALQAVRGKADIRFAHNPLFDFHGCNYSLACAADDPRADGASRLLVAEGDSLLPVGSIRQMCDTGDRTSILLRAPSHILPQKSVVAIGEGGKVRRFAYDVYHKDALRGANLQMGEQVLGESMQLWSLAGAAKQKLLAHLRQYANRAARNSGPMTDSGVYSINASHLILQAVYAKIPEEWVNLNTRQDVQKLEESPWYPIPK